MRTIERIGLVRDGLERDEIATRRRVEDEAIAGGASVTIGLSFEVEDQAKPACVAEVIYRYYA